MSDSYRVLLAIHVLCAVLWVGGGVTLHILGQRARAGGPERMRQYVADASWIGPKYFAPLSVVLLLAGIFLVDEAGFEQSELFITLGYLGWLTSFVIGVAVYPRIEKQMAAATTDEEFTSIFARYGRVNQIEILILVLIVIDMAVKPGMG